VSTSWEPDFTLPDQEVLEGFAGHATPHREQEGLELEDFVQEAVNVMNAPDVVVTLDQKGSSNTLFGNETLNRVVYQNEEKPELSTTFIPSGPGGVAGYVGRAVIAKSDSNPEFLLNDLETSSESTALNGVTSDVDLVQQVPDPSGRAEIEVVDESVESTESNWL